MGVFGGHRQRHADPQEAEAARVQDAGQLLAVPARQVDGDLRPEMRVAAVEHQPVLGAHLGLNIQRQLQRVDFSAVQGGGVRVLLQVGQGLGHPFAAPMAVGVKPVALERPGPTCFEFQQCVQKSAWVAQQHMVGRSVHLDFFVRAVHADQLQRVRKQRRVAKVHLVVQAPADHDDQVTGLQGLARGLVLVNVRQAHVGLAVFAQQLLVVRNVEDRDVQGCTGGFKLGGAAGPPDTMAANQDGAFGRGDQGQQRRQRRGIWPGARWWRGAAQVRPFLAPGVGRE